MLTDDETKRNCCDTSRNAENHVAKRQHYASTLTLMYPADLRDNQAASQVTCFIFHKNLLFS